jgi:hypothetical protein
MIVRIGGAPVRNSIFNLGQPINAMAPGERFFTTRARERAREKRQALDEMERAENANIEPPSDAELVAAAKRILEEG